MTAVPAKIAPVAVALATFNRKALLLEALQSCRRQTVWPAQIVVVDDGSSDGTREAVAALGWPELTYANPGKVGLGRVRNLATSLCTTDYLCVLDDDDIMLPNRIHDHMAAFVDGAQMSHGGWINFDAHGRLQFKPGKPVSEDVILYAGGAVTHGACCYATELLRAFPYREDIDAGIDFDLIVRLMQRGLTCAHTGSYVLLRRLHDSNTSQRHRDVQRGVRGAVIDAINQTRSPDELAQRRMRAASQGELIATPVPSLDDLCGTIGRRTQSLRIVVSVPRRAADFFAFVDGLKTGWGHFDISDERSDFPSTLQIGFHPTTSLDDLQEIQADVMASGYLPEVRPADRVPRNSRSLSNIPVPEGHVRLALESRDVRELYLAYRVLRYRNTWTWYLSAGQAGRKPIYWLITAPLASDRPPAERDSYAADLQASIAEEVDLPVHALAK